MTVKACKWYLLAIGEGPSMFRSLGGCAVASQVFTEPSRYSSTICLLACYRFAGCVETATIWCSTPPPLHVLASGRYTVDSTPMCLQTLCLHALHGYWTCGLL